MKISLLSVPAVSKSPAAKLSVSGMAKLPVVLRPVNLLYCGVTTNKLSPNFS